MENERYLPIDEDGYFVFDGRRVDDEAIGREMIGALRVDNRAIKTSLRGQDAWVEAFDAPIMARHLRRDPNVSGEGILDLPYRAEARFAFSTLMVDEWDRFHGYTTTGLPFVLSRQAQVELFDALDAFDDDSITVAGHQYPTPPWLPPTDAPRTNDFWSQLYREGEPPWEQGHESKALPIVLPQLKLSKSRVLVLGCGSGHDAAYFASQGHTVTAVDFSAEAIERAKKLYGGRENLQFVESDIFKLPEAWAGQFDLIFEHTCYCAISPDRRNDLVKLWRKLLHARGHLLGVFFVMERRDGPAFGGSEWEVKQRLKDKFRALFWTRWRQSTPDRKGKELVVYAERA